VRLAGNPTLGKKGKSNEGEERIATQAREVFMFIPGKKSKNLDAGREERGEEKKDS